MVAGICGGLGEYFDVDPTILRVVWIFFTIITGGVPGITIYLLVWVVVPKRPKGTIVETKTEPESTSADTSID